MYQAGCLIAGPSPVQTGVAPGTIDEARATVLRGQVADQQGAPLPGVRVAVLNHPELGQTLTRTDGAFDLLVNGGDELTLTFTRRGSIPVRRQVFADWQHYAHVPAVRLLEPAAASAPIALGSAAAPATTTATQRGGVGSRASGLTVEPGARLHVPGTVVHMIARFVNRAFRVAGPQERTALLARIPAALQRSDWALLAYAVMSGGGRDGSA